MALSDRNRQRDRGNRPLDSRVSCITVQEESQPLPGPFLPQRDQFMEWIDRAFFVLPAMPMTIMTGRRSGRHAPRPVAAS